MDNNQKPTSRRKNMKEAIELLDDEELRLLEICAHLGRAFTHMHLMEQAVRSAMIMCDKVQITKKLSNDATAFDKISSKIEATNKSTTGQLLGILKRHNLDYRSIIYLESIVSIRNDFVHKFFMSRPFPGEISDDVDATAIINEIKKVESKFQNCAHLILFILHKNDLIIRNKFSDGALYFNEVVFEEQ